MVSKWAPLVILIFQKRILGLRKVLDQAGPRTWICLSSVLTEPRERAGNRGWAYWSHLPAPGRLNLKQKGIATCYGGFKICSQVL